MRDDEREICGPFETTVICDSFISQSDSEMYGGGSTTGAVELEDAAADLDGGASRISTISNRASVATTRDQADHHVRRL